MKNESVKKPLEKSKNVLEEKRKIVKQKIFIKKDQHVYINCYELRSREINQEKTNNRLSYRFAATVPTEFKKDQHDSNIFTAFKFTILIFNINFTAINNGA